MVCANFYCCYLVVIDFSLGIATSCYWKRRLASCVMTLFEPALFWVKTQQMLLSYPLVWGCQRALQRRRSRYRFYNLQPASIVAAMPPAISSTVKLASSWRFSKSLLTNCTKWPCYKSWSLQQVSLQLEALLPTTLQNTCPSLVFCVCYLNSYL